MIGLIVAVSTSGFATAKVVASRGNSRGNRGPLPLLRIFGGLILEVAKPQGLCTVEFPDCLSRRRCELKRLSQNRDLFEASPNEPITVTVEASNTPYQVTFSSFESGAKCTSVQNPTPAQPIEKRKFTMPSTSRELFVILYAFPPSGQTDLNAKYRVTFAGEGGTSDGPNDVLPPIAGDVEDLPYEFRLPGTSAPTFISGAQATAAPPRSTRKKVSSHK